MHVEFEKDAQTYFNWEGRYIIWETCASIYICEVNFMCKMHTLQKHVTSLIDFPMGINTKHALAV